MRWVALRIALLGGAAAACSEVLGADDYRVDTGHGGETSAPVPAGPDGAMGPDAAATCDGCLETACAAELASCQADPTCTAALECDLACAPGDLECVSLCAGRYLISERGIEPYALLACRAAHCTAPCGMPCDGMCLGNLGCDQCLARECGAATRDLLGATDGPARLACAVSTMGITSALSDLAGCSASLPGPDAEWRAWDSCRIDLCSSYCAFQTLTPDFRCVNQTARTAAARDLSVLNFEVRAGLDLAFAPAEGVEVRFCQIGTRQCDPEQEPPVTDAHGVATLSAPRTTVGTFFEYLELVDPSGDIDDTLLVTIPPLVHSARLSALAMRKDIMDDYYRTAGAIFDRERFGHVTIIPLSCGGVMGGAGLYFESELSETTYYFDTGFNSRPDLTETTDAGVGGFTDVREGVGRFTVKQRGTDEIISSVTAPVRVGAVTAIYAAPGEW